MQSHSIIHKQNIRILFVLQIHNSAAIMLAKLHSLAWRAIRQELDSDSDDDKTSDNETSDDTTNDEETSEDETSDDATFWETRV